MQRIYKVPENLYDYKYEIPLSPLVSRPRPGWKPPKAKKISQTEPKVRWYTPFHFDTPKRPSSPPPCTNPEDPRCSKRREKDPTDFVDFYEGLQPLFEIREPAKESRRKKRKRDPEIRQIVREMSPPSPMSPIPDSPTRTRWYTPPRIDVPERSSSPNCLNPEDPRCKKYYQFVDFYENVEPLFETEPDATISLHPDEEDYEYLFENFEPTKQKYIYVD